MSGTSLDGMDVVYSKVEDRPDGYHILKKHHVFQKFQPAFQEMARRIAKENLLYEGNLYSIRWVEMANDLIQTLLSQHSLSMEDLDLIGIHGQTVLHKPKPTPFLGKKIKCTIQLANLSYLAEKTGITVVGNFRQRDMAVGGQGAPFMSHIHKILFGSLYPKLSLHNLGGIGNATVIQNNKIISAFDTGPANLWIDTILRWHTKGRKHFDENGNLARRGTPNETIIKKLLQNPYLRKKPPKSAGWDEFGEPVLIKFKKDLLKLKLHDAISTMTHAMVQATADAYQKFVFPTAKLDAIIFCGGGCQNGFVLELMQKSMPDVKIQTSNEHGIPGGELESLGFGLLGLECLLGRNNNSPAATGASKEVLCGEVAVGHRKKHIDRLKTFFQSEAV